MPEKQRANSHWYVFCFLFQFIKVQRTKKRVVAVKYGELSIQPIMIMSMTGPLGHRDINVIAKRNCKSGNQKSAASVPEKSKTNMTRVSV
jgi:hypothetical protein